MRLNTELLLKIKQYILLEPRRCNMSAWMCKRDMKSLWEHYGQAEPPCGTVGCIAGWALMLTNEEVYGQHLCIAERAASALGLSYEKADRLFLPYSRWPESWRMKLIEHKIGSPEYAQVVADYIDYFIEKEGPINETTTTSIGSQEDHP